MADTTFFLLLPTFSSLFAPAEEWVENEELRRSTLPVGFVDGLDWMLEDPPAVKKGYGLYFPMCSYGAEWETKTKW